jgi:hypothetical protein
VTSDDSEPPSQSILCAPHEEWTPMGSTEQIKSRVWGDVRPGGLPFMTDRF